jgi:hypothetical protein
MEELKSCLFCGKPVDRDYAYCPWCGYEFGPGDDVPITRRESSSAAAAPAVDPVPEPVSVPAEASGPGQSVLLRLITLEELLSDMERELDLILRTSSADP